MPWLLLFIKYVCSLFFLHLLLLRFKFVFEKTFDLLNKFVSSQLFERLRSLLGRKTDARQDHFHNAHGVRVVQCQYVFSNLRSKLQNQCTAVTYSQFLRTYIGIFDRKRLEICQKATISKIIKLRVCANQIRSQNQCTVCTLF